MTKYFITNHRKVWTGSEHKYICDVMTFSGWTVSLAYEGVEQTEAWEIVRKLAEEAEKSERETNEQR